MSAVDPILEVDFSNWPLSGFPKGAQPNGAVFFAVDTENLKDGWNGARFNHYISIEGLIRDYKGIKGEWGIRYMDTAYGTLGDSQNWTFGDSGGYHEDSLDYFLERAIEVMGTGFEVGRTKAYPYSDRAIILAMDE